MVKYEGDSNYQKLIVKIYGIFKTDSGVNLKANQKEYGYNLTIRNILYSFPINITNTGDYDHKIGTRHNSTSTYYWLNRVVYKTEGSHLFANDAIIYYAYHSDRGYGLSLRFVTK